MTPPEADPAAHDLAAHGAFLRGLAAALLGDAAAAEDVAQESLLAWHSAPRGDVRDPRAWTARVARFLALKRRRGEARRAARERAVARPESTRRDPHGSGDPDPRANALASVTAAVLALDSRYRDVVLARFFEDLSPSEIAAREAVPLATVKSRLARALDRLRAALDQQHGGDRRAWSLGLAALCRSELAPAGALAGGSGAIAAGSGATIGGIVVTAKLKLALVSVAALVAVALLGWRLFSTPGEHADVLADAGARTELRAAAAAPSESAGEAELASALVAPPSDAARVEAAGATEAELPAEAVGELVVAVRWSDGSPAAGVLVKIHPLVFGYREPDARVLTSGPDGRMRFAALPPGAVSAYADRSGFASAEVVAGGTGDAAAVAEITLPRGLDIVGRVVDARGNRIAGAEVWLSDHGNGTQGLRVGASDGHGEFVLRAVNDQHGICVRKAGLGPSWMRWVQGSEGDVLELDFVLPDAGGGLRVQAVDEDDAPLAGVVVQIHGENGERAVAPDGVPGLQRPLPVTLVTDADGWCEAPSLMPGTLELKAAAPAHAPQGRAVDVTAGKTASVVLRFDAGFRVEGTVSAGDGTPLASVDLITGNYDLLGTRTRSDAQGRYVFAHLPAGEARVRAVKRDVGRDDVVLAGAVGDALTWDPVIDAGNVLSVRLQDEEGEPLADWWVVVQGPDANRSGGYRASGATDGEGRYRAVNTPPNGLAVAAYSERFGAGIASARFADLAAAPAGRSDEHELVVPRAMRASARVSGRVIDADGRPSAQSVWLMHSAGGDGAHGTTASHVDGSFSFGLLPPGDYALRVGDFDAIRASQELTLAAGQELELGDVRLGELARLVVVHDPAAEVAVERVYVSVVDPATRRGAWSGALSELETGVELTPGRYSVELRGGVPETHEVELRAGETTRLVVAPRPAVHVTLSFRAADGGPLPETLAVTLSGDPPTTQTLYPRPVEAPPGIELPPELQGAAIATLSLELGEPRLARFTSPDGFVGEAWITAENMNPQTRAEAFVQVTLARAR